MNKILKSVGAFADELLLYQGAHNKDLVKEVLQFDVHMLDVTESKDVTKYIVVLGQYLITVTSQQAAMRVQYNLLNRNFIRQLKSISSDYKGSSAGEREAKAVVDRSDLRELEHEVEEAKAKVDVLEGREKATIELINGFKAELGRRYKEREISNKERRM